VLSVVEEEEDVVDEKKGERDGVSGHSGESWRL
jgi:hypothetical protein